MLKKFFLITISLFLVFSKTFADFTPFTGKVIGSRVRLRTQPNLEAPIITQVKAGDMYIIQGETDEFYSILPPEGTKVYIHRKFVLDGEIDGDRINVRLQPDLDSPIIAQLNNGDKVEGTRSGENNKWLAIDPPKETRFYVYKDYIENSGGPEVYLRLEKTKQKYQKLISSAPAAIQEEFQKPFEEIQINQLLSDLNQVVKDQERFPAYAEKAQEIILNANQQYLNKKITYLETITEKSSKVWERKNENLKKEITQQREQAETLAKKLETPAVRQPQEYKTPEMLYWEPSEAVVYEQWAMSRDGYSNYESFYADQEKQATLLQGTLSRPNHTANNAPGDYVLLNERTGLPIAYLYSTRVNLQNLLGRRVTIRGVKRPNNHFAFPAYYVLSAS